MKARPAALAAALAAVLALALSACSSDHNARKSSDVELSATPAAQASAPPSGAAVVSVTVRGSSVTPAAHTVKVKTGQPIVFKIDADKAGELHVHSSPAKAINYPAGQSQVQISFSRPGVIEAEIEQLGKLVVDLEVH